MRKENATEKEKKDGKKRSESALVTKESLSAVCALFLLFSLLILCTRDVIFGGVGETVFYFIMGTFGYASYPLLLFGLYISVTSLFGVRLVKNRKAATALFFSLFFLTLVLQVALTQNIPESEYLKTCWARGEKFSTATVGGVAFGAIAFGLIAITKPIGAIIIFACFFLFSAYLFVISVKKKALFHKKPVMEDDEAGEETETSAVTVEGEPLQELANSASGNVQNYGSNAYMQEDPNAGVGRASRSGNAPYAGGNTPQGNPTAARSRNTANVTQRPAFMLSDETAQNAPNATEADGRAQRSDHGAFSPFGYNEDRQNAAGRPAQVNETPQSGREFLFGLDPAESYRRNLIFDESANVNRRQPYAQSPNETGRASAYTPSYLNDYENSVNESTPTQTQYTQAPSTPVYPAQEHREEYSQQEPPQGPQEDRVFRTGFGSEEPSEPRRGETDPQSNYGIPQETRGETRGFDGSGSDRGYELNVPEEPYTQARPTQDELDGGRDGAFGRGYDDRLEQDNDPFGDDRREGYDDRSAFLDGRGFEEESGRFETPASRFDGGEENVYDGRDERGATPNEPRSDRGVSYPTYSERGGDVYELRDSDDERGDGSAFRIFDDDGNGRFDREDERAEDRFSDRDDREGEDEFRDGTFGFDDDRSGRGEEPVARPEERPVEAPPPPPPKPRVIKPYVRVPIDMFDCRDVVPDANEVEVARTKEIIIETLGYFKVNDATISSVTFGPTVTRYNVVVPRNIAAKKVVALDQEIALNLQAKEGVNIYPNFEDGAVSIEVPNRKRQFVQLGCMLTGDAYVNAKPNSLTFSMGKDVGNRKVYGDICKMIHLLVAGSSGSGKSVFLGSLILSLITKYSPSELRLILIDPKKTEFVLYNNLPHLMINEIITDVNKAIQSLNWAIGEMNRRYTLFETMSREGTYVVNIDEYNAHLPEGEEKLPKIVVIIDELADLMLAAKKEVEDRIQNLTQKARAAGIHLIVATQRPSADVITGVIKGNLPTRIAFAVASDVDSRVILDQTGAQKLLGKGDFLYTMSGVNTPVRVQSAFSSSEESQNVIRYIKMNNEAYFDETATAFINNTHSTGDDSSVAGEESVEEVYIDALRFVLMAGNASISMIQRKCGVGYNRAGKIIEWMEEMGYISAFDGAKARKVLISKEEFVSKYGPL